MFDSQENPFLDADTNGAQTQPTSTPVTSRNPDEASRFDSSPDDSVPGTSGGTPLFESSTSDWKSTLKTNYAASLTDGDPLDGVAWTKLAQMRTKPSAIANGDVGAGNDRVTTDAGGSPGQKWNKDKTLKHLNTNVNPQSTGYCATYVRQAIEAGGIRLDRSLNPAGGSAYGYGPVLEGAGFKPVPEGTSPQAGDVVIVPKSPGHKDGHAAMFNGENGYQTSSKTVCTPAIERKTRVCLMQFIAGLEYMCCLRYDFRVGAGI